MEFNSLGKCLGSCLGNCCQLLGVRQSKTRAGEFGARLAATEPTHVESRGAFVTRLRAAVPWVDAHWAAYLRQLCNSQKARAAAVLTATPAGSRTQN